MTVVPDAGDPVVLKIVEVIALEVVQAVVVLVQAAVVAVINICDD